MSLNDKRFVETTYRIYHPQVIAVVHLRLSSLAVSFELGQSVVNLINMERLTNNARLVDLPFNFPFADDDQVARAVRVFGANVDKALKPFME